MLVPLRCPHCQGELPPPAAGQAALTCPFCGTSSLLAPAAAAARDPAVDFFAALRIEMPLPAAVETMVANLLGDRAAAAGPARAVLRRLERTPDLAADDGEVVRLIRAELAGRPT